MAPMARMARLSTLVADWAVACRTWGLRLLSPLETQLRQPGALGPVPPLWLRRHAGPVRAFRSSAEGAVSLLERLELLSPATRVLDFGCGPGSLVPLLQCRLGPEARYLGLDRHAPSIAWCSGAFAGDSRFAFRPLPGSLWPAESGAWDLVVAKSVFTHLLEPDARAALAEIRRCLAPDGRALITAFCFDGERFGDRALPWFPHPADRSPVRWRRAGRPTAAVAYERFFLESLCVDSGLRPVNFVFGFFPGGETLMRGQDSLVLCPA